ncbi:MAG: hypothetical protein JWQ27_1931 [Ferruginibacter sp.]|nr:hypothetical protein [Ferruginibacter sp.]
MKGRILAMIPDSYEGLLVIDAGDPSIRWEEKGEEFMLSGEMYDVAKSKLVNGKETLYCINDDKEQVFLHDFSQAIKHATGNSKGNKYLLKFQLPDFCVTGLPGKTAELFCPGESKNILPPCILANRFREVHAPPPRS